MKPSNNLKNKTPSDTSGWQFFRTTTGIQSGPDAFDNPTVGKGGHAPLF